MPADQADACVAELRAAGFASAARIGEVLELGAAGGKGEGEEGRCISLLLH